MFDGPNGPSEAKLGLPIYDARFLLTMEKHRGSSLPVNLPDCGAEHEKIWVSGRVETCWTHRCFSIVA